MRIVGGQFSGRPIIAPKGVDTRPTTDRTRESLFNILAHRDDFDMDDVRVVDLFAGSGALGLEAISRGAAYCLFVEEAAKARAAIRENIEALGLFGDTRIHRRSATALGAMPASAGGPFGLAFLDAPYDRDLTEPALAGLRDGDWLLPGAMCVVEQGTKEAPALPDGFSEDDRRKFGDTQIGLLRFQP
ncbi:MAG: 16S rRNA (guanine(966)-N(2))-methyltransferase RsmD [Aquisalinus sp.]|nr:16S rRNA (guanine(966)-N(2))-methyltransferase RsmD [Aquisalinus sp.]